MTPRAWAALLLVGATTMAPLAGADHWSQQPPLAPDYIEAGPGDQIGEIRLSWTVPYWTHAPSFRIFRGDTAGSETFVAQVLAQRGPGGMETFIDTDRPIGTNAYYSVSAVNAYGESELSDTACSAPYPWAATRGDVAIDATCDLRGGLIAVSGTGDARATRVIDVTNELYGPCWTLGTCIHIGGVAVSGTGSASAPRSHGCLYYNPYEPARPCTGPWSVPGVAVSACDTLAAQGRREACVSDEELLP